MKSDREYFSVVRHLNQGYDVALAWRSSMIFDLSVHRWMDSRERERLLFRRNRVIEYFYGVSRRWGVPKNMLPGGNNGVTKR